jgi:hypothetical protein
MRIIPLCFAALLLAGCAEGGGGFGTLGGSLGGAVPRPKTIVVSDFVFPPDVVAVDRNFTARLERKVGSFQTFERKQRTNERVNDEIVASIVASLREAGLDARPGNEDTLSLKDDAVIVSGRLRAADPVAAKNNQAGFGSGRGGVIADMTVARLAGGGKRQLLAFAADGGKRPSAPATGKLAASRNAAIAESLVASNAAAERLSSDVEAQARSLGRAVGDKVTGFAKEQGWLTKPEGAEAAPEEGTRVRLPEPKPEKKTERKPARPADPDASENPQD